MRRGDVDLLVIVPRVGRPVHPRRGPHGRPRPPGGALARPPARAERRGLRRSWARPSATSSTRRPCGRPTSCARARRARSRCSRTASSHRRGPRPAAELLTGDRPRPPRRSSPGGDPRGAAAPLRRRCAPTSGSARTPTSSRSASPRASSCAASCSSPRARRSAPPIARALRDLATQVSLALGSAELTEEVHSRRSEARFGSLVRHSSDLITVLGADGTIVYQSPSSLASSASTPDELAGTRFEALLAPGDSTRLSRSWATARRATPGRPRSSRPRCATATARARSSRSSTRTCSRTSTSTASS